MHVAIRPEKVKLSKELTRSSSEYNWTQGIVQDIVYLGDVSVYYVRLQSGKIALSTVTNTVRAAERQIQWDDKVFLSWNPENGIVLTI